MLNCRRPIKKLRALARDPGVDLWALDEVHFQQHGSRCRMWVPPEIKDPILLHAPARKSVGYFGAVRLRDGVTYQKRGEAFRRRDAIDRMPRFQVTGSGVREALLNEQIACKNHAYEFGIDRPDITDWEWSYE